MSIRGLTLVEMLITIVILSILLSIATPSFTELLHKQRASSYMQQFSRHLHYARIKASISQLPVQVCPTTAGKCQGNWQQHPIQLTLINPLSADTILLREIPKVPTQHRLSYNRQQIQFRRDGSLDALENGTFYYCPPAPYQWHYRLVLNQAGRNRLSQHPESCPV
ncbi:hypothetical protein GCM10010919_27280 [Alishewanella longhuensis]|uniref:Type II secretion system protein H n=1 Tax=Alishewanella longhuensis TaxID=1091037 RepID=A0ABQ3L305_9ALTE|nr:GspH/FimT family pseudopilin [Alishewanella longhuensis]GHG73973.1 hypothetical protein GCM10010919_27280 [Alishewanella longhuensis]